MADRYDQEIERLLGLLRHEIRQRPVSIRSLEKKMGVGETLYQKVLTGKVNLTVRHLLELADALELDWGSFFLKAYAPEPPPMTDEQFDERVAAALRRLLSGRSPSYPSGEETLRLESETRPPGEPG